VGGAPLPALPEHTAPSLPALQSGVEKEEKLPDHLPPEGVGQGDTKEATPAPASDEKAAPATLGPASPPGAPSDTDARPAPTMLPPAEGDSNVPRLPPVGDPGLRKE
jgi:hypothetical protein